MCLYVFSYLILEIQDKLSNSAQENGISYLSTSKSIFVK